MKHPGEEQLVLHYYGENEDSSVGDHLRQCEACQEEFAYLEQFLSSLREWTPPRRPEDYGRRVWEKIEPRLQASASAPVEFPRVFPWRWAAVAAMVLAAFFLGRYVPQLPEDPSATHLSDVRERDVRERILAVAVGDHLERSRMVLTDFTNNGSVDIAMEQQRAGELIEANRLYRQSASMSGDVLISTLLEDLERGLLEIARAPSRLSSREIEALRTQIQARELLFKLRVLSEKLQNLESF